MGIPRRRWFPIAATLAAASACGVAPSEGAAPAGDTIILPEVAAALLSADAVVLPVAETVPPADDAAPTDPGTDTGTDTSADVHGTVVITPGDASDEAVRVDPPEPPVEPPVEAGVPEPVGPTAGIDQVWLDLAECESNQRWDYNGPSGYDGGLQFHPNTWIGVGGDDFAPFAWQATPQEQVIVAERLLEVQGWGAWPTCARKLGLR